MKDIDEKTRGIIVKKLRKSRGGLGAVATILDVPKEYNPISMLTVLIHYFEGEIPKSAEEIETILLAVADKIEAIRVMYPSEMRIAMAFSSVKFVASQLKPTWFATKKAQWKELGAELKNNPE